MNLFSYIKQRLPILDVVSEYATLKKAGLYYKGCCPFHHERTASFSVSPHREMFYCFGCHAGGDVISFIAKIEHCSPLEAARHLVDRYQIPVPEEITWEKSSHKEDAKKLYHTTCSIFAEWCATMLENNGGAHAYLTDRSITEESIKEWTLGYCPTDIRGLLSIAQKKGILAQNFIDAQILREGRTGLYTPFEERIMFPIRDHLGRFVGFGGRVFKKDDQRAKYYNSHDHEFFNKGTILYGLHRAKKVIAQKEAAYLVEGYTDLIIMNQFGFTHTVATLGTACTLEHLKQLARYAKRMYITYDGDMAGQNAMLRLVDLCWQVALDPYVLTLPTTDDPASFLLSGGNLQEKMDAACDIFSFVVQHLAEDFKSKSLQDRLAIAKKVITLIHQIPDALKRNLLLKQASDTFELPLATLTMNTPPQSHKSYTRSIQSADTASRDQTAAAESRQHPEISQLEKKLFSAILYHRTQLTEEDKDLISLFLDEHPKKLFNLIRTYKEAEGADFNALFEFLDEEEKALIAQISMTNEENQKQVPQDTESVIALFYKKQWKKKVHDVKLRVYEAQQQGNGERVKFLLNDLNALKKKMLGRRIA